MELSQSMLQSTVDKPVVVSSEDTGIGIPYTTITNTVIILQSFNFINIIYLNFILDCTYWKCKCLYI